uniref:Tudor domain-containing protein n=1 Tax=Strongyloides papillosus TaxID=174720 RepID=A0A0N5BYS9_STREA
MNNKDFKGNGSPVPNEFKPKESFKPAYNVRKDFDNQERNARVSDNNLQAIDDTICAQQSRIICDRIGRLRHNIDNLSEENSYEPLMYSAKESHDFYIPIKFPDDVTTIALVDGGATKGVIRESRANALGFRKEISRIKPVCTLANGEIWPTLGMLRTKITLTNNVSVNLNFHVVRDSDLKDKNYSVVLGSDFLTTTNAWLDYGRKVIEIAGRPIVTIDFKDNKKFSSVRIRSIRDNFKRSKMTQSADKLVNVIPKNVKGNSNNEVHKSKEKFGLSQLSRDNFAHLSYGRSKSYSQRRRSWKNVPNDIKSNYSWHNLVPKATVFYNSSISSTLKRSLQNSWHGNEPAFKYNVQNYEINSNSLIDRDSSKHEKQASWKVTQIRKLSPIAPGTKVLVKIPQLNEKDEIGKFQMKYESGYVVINRENNSFYVMKDNYHTYRKTQVKFSKIDTSDVNL